MTRLRISALVVGLLWCSTAVPGHTLDIESSIASLGCYMAVPHGDRDFHTPCTFEDKRNHMNNVLIPCAENFLEMFPTTGMTARSLTVETLRFIRRYEEKFAGPVHGPAHLSQRDQKVHKALADLQSNLTCIFTLYMMKRDMMRRVEKHRE